MSTSQNTEANSSIKNSEGQLANKLHSACNVTCEKFISSIKLSMVKKILQPIYEKNPTAVKNLHNQLCSHLRKSLHEEVDEVCKEYSIDFLLNSLEVIKKNQDPSQPSWRPSGNAEEDIRDHLYPQKVKQKEALQTVLNSLMASNEDLVNCVTIQHAEIMHIKKSNDDLQEKFSDIMTALTGTNLENLQSTMDNTMEKL